MNEKIIIGILIVAVFVLSGAWYRDNKRDADELKRTETKYNDTINELRGTQQKAIDRANNLEIQLGEANRTACELRKRTEQLQATILNITNTATSIDTGLGTAQGTVAESQRIINDLRRAIQGL